MKLKNITLLLFNTLFVVSGFFIVGILNSSFRKNTKLFKVDIKTIEKDLILSRSNTLENTGWPTKKFASENLKDNKYRKLDNNSLSSCIEVYGGSYTYSFNSKRPKDTWSNNLSNYLDCSVLNYGIPGFGTDQSVIRHEKYKSNKNISILMFVDDSLKRNLYPMLGLSYSGLAKNYDNKTFKPFYKVINNNLVLIKPNQKEIYDAINKEKKKICLGPSSLFCIFNEIYNEVIFSIKTKGKYYQYIAKISKPFSDYVVSKIELKSNNQIEYSLDLQSKLIQKYLANCESIGQTCYLTRFPYMRDVAYPSRILINPIEETLEKNFQNKYISSYTTANCMKSILGTSNKKKSIDLSVMKYEHSKNKHYLDKANNAFAKCLSIAMKDF